MDARATEEKACQKSLQASVTSIPTSTHTKTVPATIRQSRRETAKPEGHQVPHSRKWQPGEHGGRSLKEEGKGAASRNKGQAGRRGTQQGRSSQKEAPVPCTAYGGKGEAGLLTNPEKLRVSYLDRTTSPPKWGDCQPGKRCNSDVQSPVICAPSRLF